MMVLYSSLLTLVLILGLPFWLVRMATSGRYRAGLPQRLGLIPPHIAAAAANRKLIWIHAVSVGEVLAAIQLIGELERALPGWLIAVSTTTETGQRLARKRLPGHPVFYLPLDLRFAVRRYLRALTPRLVVLMESELWPRLLVECERAGIPLAVANARISDRSFPRYMRLRRLWRPLLAKVSLLLAQSGETASRLQQIGVSPTRILTVGNLKFDVRITGTNAMTERLRELLPPAARILIAGSTLEGEEKLLLDAWTSIAQKIPDAVMILAPRHPDRFAAVETLLSASSVPHVRATSLKAPIAPGAVVLLDTIGDLASVYSLASVAFIGGSMISAGGHNPLEPAQFAVPVVMGPSVENFREVVQIMQADDAILLVAPEHLEATLLDLLVNGEEARALGIRGRVVFRAEAGATARTVEALTGLLEDRAGVQ